MRVGSTDGGAPYMSLRKDAGQAWLGYSHPTNDGYATLALRDRYIWLGAYDSNGKVVSRLYGDADSIELTAGTRNLALRGRDVFVSSTRNVVSTQTAICICPACRQGLAQSRLGEMGTSAISHHLERASSSKPIESTVESFEDKLLSVDAKTSVDRRTPESIADQQTAIASGEDHKELPEGIGRT